MALSRLAVRRAGKPRQGVARVVATAREAGIDDGRLYELMTSPLGLRDGGRRLADLLVDGREDDVVAAVRAAALGGRGRRRADDRDVAAHGLHVERHDAAPRRSSALA